MKEHKIDTLKFKLGRMVAGNASLAIPKRQSKKNFSRGSMPPDAPRDGKNDVSPLHGSKKIFCHHTLKCHAQICLRKMAGMLFELFSVELVGQYLSRSSVLS